MIFEFMSHSELNEKNFKRITIINWGLSLPLFILFSWPYLYISRTFEIDTVLSYPGCLLFAFALILTILHGNVTMAVGSVHRHHYYHWLENRPFTYGLFYHVLFTSTRFRLILLLVGLLLLPTGYLLGL